VIERSVVVRAQPEAAFRVWTQQIALWWPRAHRVSGNPDGEMVLEGAVGGRLFERAVDGRELDYGRVLEWSPPAFLALAFFLGGAHATPTRVELRFTGVAEGTRVELVHRAGELPPDRFEQTAPRFGSNWDTIFAAFAAQCAGAEPSESE
jgi:uncharacterized protein YndB with AHSA1/START domain